MTEKYRKIVNHPIKKLRSAMKTVYEKKATTKPKKVLKASALVGMGLAEFMMRFAKFATLDNKLLRKLEKRLAEINVGKNKEGHDKKFQVFIKRNPNLSAVAIWWAMFAMLISGGNLALGNKADNGGIIKKMEIKAKQHKNSDGKTVSYVDAVDKKAEISKKLNKRIKMTDKAAIKQAVMENFAYTQVALFATENYRTDWFCDNVKGNKNTLGVGLYYVPSSKNPYQFNTSEWCLASNMFHKYPRDKGGAEPRGLTDDEVYDAIEGWFFYMDNGRNFNHYMCDVLAGSNIYLTPKDLTVIESVLFNSPACGKKFCEFIVAHPDKRLEWAKYLLQVDDDVDKSRLKNYRGLKSRRVHEILLLLNVDNYCQDMFGVQIDCNRSGAVSYANNYFDKLRKDFSQANLLDAKSVICCGVVANGVSICQVVQRAEEHRDDVFAYCVDVDKYLYSNQSVQQLYNEALNSYNKKDYDAALKGFSKVIELKGMSPDLFNDLAITYIHRGEYDKSIEMSNRALLIESEDIDRSSTYFNLGYAYGLKGDLKNAKKYYKQAADLDNSVAASKLKEMQDAEISQFANASKTVDGKRARSGFFKGLVLKRE